MAKLETRTYPALDLETIHLSDLVGADIVVATSTVLQLRRPDLGLTVDFGGVGFTYDSDDQLSGGTITSIRYVSPTADFTLSGVNVAATTAAFWMVLDAMPTALSTVLAGNDTINDEFTHSILRGYGGNDLMHGSAGADTLYGGTGDDTLSSDFYGSMTIQDGRSFQRGEEGNDSLVGGAHFDDLHGNQGNDTLRGSEGDDWVVGGKDNDLLYGDYSRYLGGVMQGPGADVIYGNMGGDTCYGGGGNDVIRGGQDGDLLFGDEGDDWISGDRGPDTMTGGAGADTFYVFTGSGSDQITDFSAAQGDRIQFEPGMTYTIGQQGVDTVIETAGGERIVLVGVEGSSLVGAWSFFLAS
ncbi:calcium-binding protein [Brevundimonas sp.]|uniref:calcium-binding protein n=1 Tax=Brevundimonas sp. TaxID=1871086 RepID=UPI0027377E99|nr:calcium-binding protein [Brevundimonas sp.]MDP3803378.1 calcium-binding protein [Brevundimonas sp.]